MILLQALVVGLIGYCFGVALSALYFETISKQKTELEGIFMYRQVMILVAICITIIVSIASVISAKKVLTLEPAVVFRG
jgi:putative ABC transport system permease protein